MALKVYNAPKGADGYMVKYSTTDFVTGDDIDVYNSLYRRASLTVNNNSAVQVTFRLNSAIYTTNRRLRREENPSYDWLPESDYFWVTKTPVPDNITVAAGESWESVPYSVEYVGSITFAGSPTDIEFVFS